MSLHQHVNNSGFPLQLAVANLVNSDRTTWSVLYEEHAWHSDTGSGFIDLVIENQSKTWLMNIECKRVRESDWIFLLTEKAQKERLYSKPWVTWRTTENPSKLFDWIGIPLVSPSSPESAYCVVRGQDSKSRPMLERIAATVVESTEALARQEADPLIGIYSTLRIYQNVIVTTARLHVCDLDVSKIDINSGELGDNTEFRVVPYVRFRKQLGASIRNNHQVSTPADLKQTIKHRESTIFVVNSAYFKTFLDEYELPDNFLARMYKLEGIE